MTRQARARCLAALALVASGGAFAAFNSADWHGKRELFAREAERMAAVYSNCVRQVNAPAENVTVPVETYEDGSVKVLVSAEKAQYFLKEGLVWGEGVTVRQLGRDGKEEGRIDARNCVIDKNARSGWVEGPARVRQGKLECRGRNVDFAAAESGVRVFEQSEVESADLKFGGLAR